jgi:Domain of unknown function (DUF4136)
MLKYSNSNKGLSVKNILVLMVSVFMFLGCSSLRVSVDYDTEYKFLQQKSFAIVHKSREGEDTLFNDRLIQALEEDLKAKGYDKTDKESADLIFVFHTNVENKTDIDTDYTMVGYRGYRYGGTMVSTTRSYHYTKGTLIIDALTPGDKKIVWRAVSTDTLTQHDTPQERTVYIKSVVKETMKDFPSKVTVKK